MKLTALPLLASLAVCATSAPALADESGPGKDHFDRGMIFYNVQDWPSAIRELRAAYETDPKPEYLYSLGQAQRQSGDCGAAILSFRAFLRQATGKASAAAEGFIHVCEAQLKTQQDAQKAAIAAPIAAGGAPGATTAPAAPAAPAPPNSTWYADPLGDTLAVLGIAGAAVGTVFFVQAGSKVSAATSAPQEGAWSANSSSAKTDSLLGGVGVGVGGVLLAGAIIRYVVVGSRGREAAASPSVGVSMGSGGLQVSYGAQF